MELRLTEDRDRLAVSLADAVRDFSARRAAELELPITRFDVQFDLTSESVPRAWAFADTEPSGKPFTGHSRTYPVWNLVLAKWAAPCQAALDGRAVTVLTAAGTTQVADEESLYQAVGPFLVGIVVDLRSAGAFNSLPRAAACFLGVSAYDGTYGWPAWRERGPANMV